MVILILNLHDLVYITILTFSLCKSQTQNKYDNVHKFHFEANFTKKTVRIYSYILALDGKIISVPTLYF